MPFHAGQAPSTCDKSTLILTYLNMQEGIDDGDSEWHSTARDVLPTVEPQTPNQIPYFQVAFTTYIVLVKILHYSQNHALISHSTALATLITHPDAHSKKHLEGGEDASTCPFNLMQMRSGKPRNKAITEVRQPIGISAELKTFPGSTEDLRVGPPLAGQHKTLD